MKLELVWGRSFSARSDYLYGKAWSRVDSGKKTIIIVPEQYTLEAEKALLNVRKNSSGMIKIQVMSIKRLMNWIFSDVRGPSDAVLDETGKTLLLKSILRKHGKELLLFDRAALTPGFSSSIGDFISDLKKFNVSGEDLFDSVDQTDKESAVYKKAHDIKKIMEYYRGESQNIKAVDADDSVDILCEVIDEASPKLKSFFADTAVYFDSFDYIPAKNISLIFSVLPHVDELSVSVTVDEQRSQELYAAGADTILSIENIAQGFGISPEYIHVKSRGNGSDKGIEHLRKYLHSYPYKTLEGDWGVKVAKAAGRNKEVEHAAAEIIHFVGSGKYKWSEISIICSGLESYGPYISRIFKAYEIPYFLDERRTLTSHPVVVWLLSAMQFAGTHLREYMLGMIKTLYTQLSYDECEEFEDYCTANSIQGSMFLKSFRRGAKIYDLNKINRYRKAVTDQVIGFDTGKKTSGDWAREIYKLLEKAKIAKTIERERARLESLGRLDEAAETAQSWNAVIKILDQLDVISSEDMLEIDDVISLLEESFLNMQIGVLPTGVNKVTVGDAGRSKTAGIKCSFILGANEGVLPTPMPEGVILSDRELEIFKQKGISAGRDGVFRKSESNFNLYRAVTAPSESLNISYDSSEGKESALIVRKILSLLPDVLVENAYVDPITAPAAAFSASAKALGAIGDSRPYRDAAWKEGMSALMQDEKYADHIDKMYNFAAGGSTQHQIMQSVDGNLTVSISQLEQYAKCPFAYMITYGLQPENDPSAEIEYISSGAYLHKVMEEFGQELKDEDLQKLTDEEIDMMMQKKARYIAAVFDEGSFTIDAKREFLSEQLIETARRSGQVYVREMKNSEFRPVAHEMTFDTGRDFGPINIELPDGKKVLLRGKIDRVDEYRLGDEKWIRAIDYKSGRKSVDLTGLMTGEDLQLFVYASALKDNTGSRAAGVFYFPLRNDYTDEDKNRSDAEKLNGVFVDNANVLKGLDTSAGAGQKSDIVNLTYKNDGQPRSSKSVKTPEYFNAAMKASMNTARSLCTMMDKGAMDVNPLADKNASACGYCDYQNICRFGAQGYNQNQKPAEQKAEEYIQSFMGGDADEMD